MTKPLALMLLAGLLAACAQTSPPEGLQATAALAGPEAVEVRVTNIPPGTEVERIALVDPSGRVIPATELQLVRVQPGPDVEPGPLFR